MTKTQETREKSCVYSGEHGYMLRCKSTEEGEHITFRATKPMESMNYELMVVFGGLTRRNPNRIHINLSKLETNDHVVYNRRVDLHKPQTENLLRMKDGVDDNNMKNIFVSAMDSCIGSIAESTIAYSVDGRRVLENTFMLPELVVLKNGIEWTTILKVENE